MTREKTKNIREIILALAIGILAFVVSNPYDFWMPRPLYMMLATVLVVFVALFAVFVWKENSADERDSQHIWKSGRVSFMVGAVVLLFGVVFEALVNHYVDPWLAFSLAAMVIAKIGSREYMRIRN